MKRREERGGECVGNREAGHPVCYGCIAVKDINKKAEKRKIPLNVSQKKKSCDRFEELTQFNNLSCKVIFLTTYSISTKPYNW